jgi:tetratricopeptide (TPR) repeat protein
MSSAGDTRNEFDGIATGPVIQGRDVNVQFELPPSVPAALNGLRAPAQAFTGRDTELAELAAYLDPAGGGGPVAVVAGLGGVGKTELAVQAARTVLERGWFPGGALMVNLHGYEPAPQRLDTGRALEQLLRCLQVPGEHIAVDPHGHPDIQARQLLLRTILTEYARMGRPILLIIDNASPDAPAEPLLPGTGPALVTSRHILSDIDARLLDLDVLSDADALDLLQRLLTRKRPADTRVTDHPDAAAQITRCCAGLPLAIEIVAALLAAHPGMPLTEMATRLHAEQHRLQELTHRERAVQAAFELSYTNLDPGQQRVFRLMSLNPGPHISTTATAALTGLDLDQARRAVEALAEAHLIEPSTPYGWWRMHDLVRLYAAHLNNADPGETDQALNRLLDHYLDTTRAAAAHLAHGVAHPESRGFATREQALEWLDTEVDNLTAAVHTAAGPRPDITIALPLRLAVYLSWRRRFSDWITLITMARDTATRTHNQPNEAAAWNSLGNALQQVGRVKEAIAAHQTALDIHRDTGDRHRVASAWNNLGNALRRVGRFEEAISAHQTALDIHRETGNRHREATAWNNLGNALQRVQRWEEAMTAHQTALDIYRELGDRHREATAWNNLGNALRGLGRWEEGIATSKTALDIYRETGDRHGEGLALVGLGRALRQVGHIDEAVQAHTRAAALFDELGDEVWHAEALRDIETDRSAGGSE